MPFPLPSLLDKFPICAVCGRRVESVSVYNNHQDGVGYRVRCHGQTEEVTLDYATIVSANSLAIGRAFETNAVRASQPQLPAAAQAPDP